MIYNYEELDNHSEDPDDNDLGTFGEPERQDICPTCLAPILNLGKEAADIYRSARLWFKCGCGTYSIIIGPSQDPKQFDDLGAWKRRQITKKR
jgi:hypothetical protein